MYITSDKIKQPQLKIIPSKVDRQELKLHQRVKVGELLRAEVIDSVQKQIKLLLADGTIFKAQLNQNVDVYIGQQINLEVIELLGNQIIMEVTPTDGEKQSSKETAIQNIIKELNLPITSEMQDIVKVLIQRMLPITKENVKQVLLGLKTSSLPIDKLMTMLENQLPITPNTLSQMEAYDNGEIKLQAQMQNVIEHILSYNDPKILEQIHKTLLKYLPSEKEPSLPGQEVLQKEFSLPGQEVLQNEPFLSEQEILQNEKPLIQQEMLQDGKSLEKSVFQLKEEISSICKEIFFIRPEQLKRKVDSKLEKINELYKTIYEITHTLEKVEKGITQTTPENVYSEVKANIEFLSIISKYDTMLHLPLIIQNQFKHGEMYVFHKKKSSKRYDQEASLLISLDTTMLGKVEVYVKKHNKQISCQFRLDDEDIEAIIKDNILSLKENLNNIGYKLSSITYIGKSQSFLESEDIQNEDITERYRFDTKV